MGGWYKVYRVKAGNRRALNRKMVQKDTLSTFWWNGQRKQSTVRMAVRNTRRTTTVRTTANRSTLVSYTVSVLWDIHGILMGYSWSIHMYRVCIGYVSGMCRECVGRYKAQVTVWASTCIKNATCVFEHKWQKEKNSA